MDDQQLERLMGDQLRETQEFDFREEDWEALAPRLKRRRLPFIFWLVLAGLLFTGLSLFGGYYYKQHQYTQKELEKTQQALDNLTSEETIIQNRTTVEIIDTVYKTVVVEQNLYTQIDTKEQGSALKTKTIFNDEVSSQSVLKLAAEEKVNPRLSIFAEIPIANNKTRTIPATNPEYSTSRERLRFFSGLSDSRPSCGATLSDLTISISAFSSAALENLLSGSLSIALSTTLSSLSSIGTLCDGGRK